MTQLLMLPSGDQTVATESHPFSSMIFPAINYKPPLIGDFPAMFDDTKGLLLPRNVDCARVQWSWTSAMASKNQSSERRATMKIQSAG